MIGKLMLARVLTVFACVFVVASAQATPIVLTVDEDASSMTGELCLTSCDADSSPVVGHVSVKLDDLTSPSELALQDFSLTLTESITLSVSGFTATGTGIAVEYAEPTTLLTTSLGAGGTFGYTGVPTDASGVVAYNASGLTCYALMAAGLPCSDSMDMAAQPSREGAFDGDISVLSGRVIHLEMSPDVSGPIDPEFPIGTLSISGSIVAEAVVPLRGDADLNGEIDGRDVQAFLGVLFDASAFSWQERYAVDMNDDDSFDMADVALFVDCLLNDACPA